MNYERTMKKKISVHVESGSRESRVLVPLYSARPQAGFPSPGDDHIEEMLDIQKLLVPNPLTTFFVRVEGDSMEGAHIFSGDVLVVDRGVTAKNGSIVVAAVYGEMVVKRLVVHDAHYMLVSEHTAYAPIDITNNEDCFIWGVVTGSARQLT